MDNLVDEKVGKKAGDNFDAEFNDTLKQVRLEIEEFAEEQQLSVDSAVLLFLKHDPRLRGDMTLHEIGIILNITRERVRQIEASAIKKIKHPKFGKVLKYYLDEPTDFRQNPLQHQVM